MTSRTGAVAQIIFTGTSVRWIAANGPMYCQVEVFIDNISKGNVDLCARNQAWQVKKFFGNLANAQHSIAIHVLGQRNPAATNSLVVDGCMYQ